MRAMIFNRTERSRKAGDGGFTLVEIMLAILILGIVVSTIYGAWAGTLRVTRDSEYVDEVYAMARNAMMHLTEDLESLAPWGGAFVLDGGPGDQGGEPLATLRFVSSRRLGFGDISGGLPEISWFARESRDGESRDLMRREGMYQGERESGSPDSYESEGAYVVARNLTSFQCLFIDEDGEEHDRWDSLSDFGNQKNRAPRLIEIRLAFQNPDNPDRPWRFMTKVTVPRAEGGLQ